ncbi:MAG: AraC family transcriptional regulator [Anaerovoracaceae bacterium]
MMTELKLKEEAASVVHHNEAEQLLTVERKEFIAGRSYETLAHWHEDIELIRIKSGEMYCHVNGQDFILRAGDVFFINKKQMHRTYPANHRSCKYTVLLINPKVISREHKLYESYINDMLSDDGFRQRLFFGDAGINDICSLSDELEMLEIDRPPAWEFELIACIFRLFGRLYIEYGSESFNNIVYIDPDVAVQRRMVQYIYDNFNERISLDDIAASGGVGRSKCCKIFKQYLRQSPVDFLNLYRLEVSCRLLEDTRESISTVAKSCGFAQQSYYNKLFLRHYDCTPGEYRNLRIK